MDFSLVASQFHFGVELHITAGALEGLKIGLKYLPFFIIVTNFHVLPEFGHGNRFAITKGTLQHFSRGQDI